MRDYLTSLVLQQKAKDKTPLPIKYWQARSINGTILDENNSIKILRHKFSGWKTVTYHAIR